MLMGDPFGVLAPTLFAPPNAIPVKSPVPNNMVVSTLTMAFQ
jgi:hypothetical protein